MKCWRLTSAIVAAALLGAIATTPPAMAADHTAHAVIDSADCAKNVIPPNDDSYSGRVDLPFNVNFYGVTYDHLWVNNNGNITFNAPLSTYTPFGLIATSVPIIAPYFADVDTRGVGSGLVHYGWGTTTYEGRQAFCVNWVDVGYYSAHADKLNSFQLLLVNRNDAGAGAFDIVFNYDQVQWETGDASGGSGGLGGYSARAGFSAGTSTPGASMELAGSGTPDAFLDSNQNGLARGRSGSNVLGRYVFQVRDQGIVANKYVALGDSFQSGEGAHAYDPTTDVSTNFCHRSANAYPNRLVDEGVVRLELNFRACSGAVIDDLYSNAVSTSRAPWDEADAQLNVLGADTKLVTVGIVGNDLGFADVLESCIKTSALDQLLHPGIYVFHDPCSDSLGAEVDGYLTSLEGGAIGKKLNKLYRDIRTRAPYARVVVVSYPRFFAQDPNLTGFIAGCQGIRSGDQLWLNNSTMRADAAIGLAAIRSGFDYVNMYSAFEGHEQCTSNSAFNGVEWISPAKGLARPESFHPNAYGHQIMADEIQQLLGAPINPSFVILPQQTVTRALYVSGTSVHVHVAWPGSDVVTTLVSPSGVLYSREAPLDADHGVGPTTEYYDIDNPEHGEWTIHLYGRDVASGGEPVTLTTLDQQPTNTPPRASFTTTGVGNTYQFNAAGSFDSDGHITDYMWDFGDGTVATGRAVDHTFPAGEQFKVILSVKDNGGLTGFTTQGRVFGSIGHVIGSSAQITNQMTVNGPLTVHGDLECNSSATVTGDVTATGNVHLTNSCTITGNLRAGGDVTIDSTPRVSGSVTATRNVRMQSTAKIGGQLRAAGIVTIIDGVSAAQMLQTGALTAEPISGDGSVGAVKFADFTPPVPPDTSSISWRAWINQIAAANSAPNWSAGLSAAPGCVAAPWGNSLNSNLVKIDSPVVIDAARSGCATVTFQSLEIRLSADITIIANGLSTVDSVSFVSADGNPHTVTVVVPGVTGCGSPNSVSLSASTIEGDKVRLDVSAAGKVALTGGATISGTLSAGCLSGSGSTRIGTI